MMRIYQARAACKASRKMVSQTTTTGLIAWIRTYNRLQLGLALVSLVSSIFLLFVGTYVYFDASIVGPSNQLPERTSLYDSILQLYGINETDFGMLFPHTPANFNFKLVNYQIGISMMFIAVISILIEVGLICAVLFENFKLSLLYTFILAGGLFQGLSSTSGQIYALSLTFQLVLLFSFVVFSLGIKAKAITVKQILERKVTSPEMELTTEQFLHQKV